MENGQARSSQDPLAQAAAAGEKRRAARPPSDPNLLTDWKAMGSTRILPDAVEAARREAELLPEDTAQPTPWEEGSPGPDTLGDFKFLKKLGEGAMGVVYKAHQLTFDRTVALKVLFKQVGSNPKLVERMYREGRIMGQLDHPNIIGGYGVGEDKGWHYIAMEFVDGESLQKWLTRLGRLSVGDAVHVTLVCARALQYAHGLDLIHRDIKPDNILITKDGQIKVADLGMVKMLDEELSLTQTGHAVGTPWYMPLEQAKNAKTTDSRSDIYALGCTLYCMLTGNPPFLGRTIFEVIKAKEEAGFTPARHLNPEVPEKLDLIINKMTAKHVKNRYQSCAEVIRDLENLDLVNEDLEFLKQPADKTRKVNVAASPKTMLASFSGVAEIETPTDDWYVRFKNDTGQVIVKRMKTADILELLDDPEFDPTAKASRKKDEGYRALATYKEFAPVLLGRVSKTGADGQTSRFRNIFKKIEAEEEIHHQLGASSGPILNETFDHWLRIFLRVGGTLAVVGLVGWLLYFVGSKITAFIFN